MTTETVTDERLRELIEARNRLGRDYLDRHADDFKDTIAALRELLALRAKVGGTHVVVPRG